jgi:hypothetical protein
MNPHALTLALAQEMEASIFGGFTLMKWESQEWKGKFGSGSNPFVFLSISDNWNANTSSFNPLFGWRVLRCIRRQMGALQPERKR